MPSDSGFPGAEYDRWLREPYENQEEGEFEECPVCEGYGWFPVRDQSGELIEQEPCANCNATGQAYVSPEELESRAKDQAASLQEDMDMEDYYHDKYGD